MPLLRMSGIRKTFGPVVALDGVDFSVGRREVHGLLGGNGAGKTTLMNVLYGLYAADAGEIEVDGNRVSISNPKEAIAAGVGMVHQSFLQVDSFTVTENIVLGTGSRGLDVQARVTELSERFGLAVDPGARVDTLPVGVRQRVEILKALYRGAKILVLDEPTTNLTPQEVDTLFSSMRAIVDEGMSVILITHKIRETMAVCDQLTVMRDGRFETRIARRDTTAEDLAALMVGAAKADDATAKVVLGEGVLGENLLPGGAADTADGDTLPRARPVRVEVDEVRADGHAGTEVVRGVSIRLRAGEILGIAGIAGNGQVELAESLTGVRRLRAGSLRLDGVEMAGRATARWLDAGVVLVPEDRQRDGILPGGSVTENLALGSHRKGATAGLINWTARRRLASGAVADYQVRTPGIAAAAGSLSGGNIQRVILARAFAHRPKLLVLHNPTRGLDIGSTQFVYERIRAAAADGCAVVVISEDEDEVIALGDRVAVIYDGSLVGEFARGATDPYELGRLMTGVTG